MEIVKVENHYIEAIEKLLDDDAKNDVEKEMIMAGDELLAAWRQAIKQVVEEQRQVVWAGLEDLRDSISNYSLNKIGEVYGSNAFRD